MLTILLSWFAGDVIMSMFMNELYGFQLDNHRWCDPLSIINADLCNLIFVKVNIVNIILCQFFFLFFEAIPSMVVYDQYSTTATF
jgi:hypothetical protein